ncbi:DUF5309 domain-containing protein [Bauldia sp.]|uniref:DUF5309 domain-containing protein n=1 Tax=Bauldia sp. TaxID=2575872 RepID=UPI003BAA8ECD
MAVPTNTYLTYNARGNREDLSDVIYRVDPTDTPFCSSVAKVKATATLHEWQTQALRAASTNNAVLEGDDATINARTATVRLSNVCQISDETASVTGTQQAVDSAGRDNEMNYQILLAGLELKRDMEAIVLTNQAKNAGDASTARNLASVLSWIKANSDMASDGDDPAAADGTGTRTDGTQRAFTEEQLKTVLNATWNSGGDPDTIMLGGFNKQVMSGFVGRGTPTEDTKAKKIVAAVDVYESDFGTLRIVPNRNNPRTRDALVLQMDMWGIATLRNMKTVELAKTGDSRKKQIICEYTVEARNEKASGGVFDLTTT